MKTKLRQLQFSLGYDLFSPKEKQANGQLMIKG